MASKPYLPLKGVRVLAFETAYSLPAGTRTLAELGAEVVRVAPPTRGFGIYISVVDGTFLCKTSIAIDLKNRRGLDLARRLIEKADVVVSNFTTRVMPSFGLGPDDLMRVKPDLIVLQLTGYGSPGPWEDYAAYGPSVEAAGGMNRLSGRESDPPVRVGSGVFADQLSGRYSALALLAALNERRNTGKGRYIDISMYEGIVNLLGQFVLNAARTGRAMPARRGNRDASIAPQGVYPCAGEDEWIAISVRSDDEWRALVGLANDPRLTAPEYATAEGRQAGHDDIDARVGRWTWGQEKVALAERLQAAGIAAGPVQKVSDIPFDPHLKARGFFQNVEHDQPMFGYMNHPHPTTPWQAEGRARKRLTDFRFAGVDNEAVLRSWLGMKQGEIAELQREGAIFMARPIATREQVGPSPGGISADFAERLGLRTAPEEDKTEAAS
jgi:crotonobetainyl-CoA:carnitine CoA-transferase CaiB-like acyl-CoA transferase